MAVNLSSPLMGPFRSGQRSDGVRLIQERLNELGAQPRVGTDGVLGPKTTAAIRAFQTRGRLKVDGVVGPVTAKALGFSHYTSLRRIRQGTLQLAGVITGTLARLVPPPHQEPTPTYDALMALLCHADAMQRLANAVADKTGLARNLQKILMDLETKLGKAVSHQYWEEVDPQNVAYAESVHSQLKRLSENFRIAATQWAPGTSYWDKVDAIRAQDDALKAMAPLLRALQAPNPAAHADPGDELLKIAASVVKATNDALRRG